MVRQPGVPIEATETVHYPAPELPANSTASSAAGPVQAIPAHLPAPPVEPAAGQAGQLTAESPVEAIRARLKELKGRVYGKKEVLWNRLQGLELEKIEKDKHRAQFQQRAEDLRAGRIPLAPTTVAVPEQPTEEERKAHMLNHLPSAPWCIHCQMGKGKASPHKLQLIESKDAKIPRVQCDYMQVKSDESPDDSAQPWATALTCVDCDTALPLSLSISTKSPNFEYKAKSLRSFIKRSLHGTVVLRSDGEPAIVALMEKVKADRLADDKQATIIEKTLRYSSQSMGHVGQIQGFIQGQIRTNKLCIEERYGDVIDPDHNLWPWLTRHSGWEVEMLHVKANERTAHYEVYQQNYTGAVAQLGETVIFKKPNSPSGRLPGKKRMQNGDSKWEKAIWLGKTYESDEHLLGTAEGVFTANTMRRFEKGNQVDKELLAKFIGVPWALGAGAGPRRRKKVNKPVTPAVEAAPALPAGGATGTSIPPAAAPATPVATPTGRAIRWRLSSPISELPSNQSIPSIWARARQIRQLGHSLSTTMRQISSGLKTSTRTAWIQSKCGPALARS